MTRDLDTLLRDADPLHDRPTDDAALLAGLRERVDRERAVIAVTGRRPNWGRRVVLVAAAAAVITAVPVVVGLVSGHDGAPALITPAVAGDGSIVCGESYAASVDPTDAAVRLLPDRLPTGWSYTQIFARDESTTGTCIAPSLTALRTDAEGRVTGRISVTGPVDAHIDEPEFLGNSVPDPLLGHEARRFDVEFEYPVQHWVWTDEQGRQWSVEASGLPLEEARQTLAAVSTDGAQVAWDAAASPGWTLVHLREGAPYGVSGQLVWHVELTDGSAPRTLTVGIARGPAVSLLAYTGIGERVTTVAGLPAVLGRPRGVEEHGREPGTRPTTPVLVDVAPGVVASTWSTGDDLPEVERMLASLREVPGDDPRLEHYGTD